VNKPVIYKAAVAFAVALSVLINVGLGICVCNSAAKARASINNCVTIDKYDQLVLAESNNAVILDKRLRDEYSKIQQNQQTVLSNQALLQTNIDDVSSRLDQLSAVTNLYEKSVELEAKINTAEDGRKLYDQQLAQVGAKFAALERGVIKLTIAVQQEEHDMAAGAVLRISQDTNAMPRIPSSAPAKPDSPPLQSNAAPVQGNLTP
jgi:chromosome segregation ATPase